jgi:hypothetical protein
MNRKLTCERRWARDNSSFHRNARSNFSEEGRKPIILNSNPLERSLTFFSARKHIGKGDRRCAMRVSRGSLATPFDEEVYGS